MRKIRSIIFVVAGLLLANSLFAQENNSSGFQFGPYFEYNMGQGAIVEHENGNAAIGVDVFYELPIKLPIVSFGVSSSVDFGAAVGKKDYIDSWYVCNGLIGAFVDFNIAKVCRIRPEVSYGMAINIVESPARNVSGPQIDQLIKLGASLIYEPQWAKGFAVYGGVDYKFMPEKENLGTFLGFKGGVLYRPSKSSEEL